MSGIDAGEIKALRRQAGRMRQVLLTQEEHEACSFVLCRDFDGLAEWALEMAALEGVERHESASIVRVSGNGRGAPA